MIQKISDNWKVLETNNTGSFSTIYKVTNDKNEIFAIKKLSLPLQQDKVELLIENGHLTKNEINDYAISQIKNEINIMEKFKDSNNILKLHQVYEEKQNEVTNFYLRMEYAEDIKTYFNNRTIDNQEIIKMCIDICNALEELEKNGVIHGDIKPGNIFIKDGIYKLGDFGSSQIITSKQQNIIYGTINYIAPEIYKKESPTYSSDIYSLGIVMYFLFSGSLPFVSDNISLNEAFELRMKGNKIPEIFGLDEKIMNIIKKACAYKKDNRYSSANEMKNDLDKLIIKKVEEKEIEFIPSEDEPTISIYDDNLLNSQRNNEIEEDTSIEIVKDKLINKKNIKKYGLILLLIIIPTLMYTHYIMNRTCSAGYINRGGMCVKGSYYCPDEYVLNTENKCQKTLESIDAKVTYTCKSGYNLMGEMCVNNDVREVEFTYKCLDGFKLNGKKCEKTESADAVVTYTCPSGYVSAGDQCVTVSNVPGTKVYKCPDSSYKMSGTKCSKTVNKTSTPNQKYVCNSGGTLNGTVCDYAVSPSYSWTGTSCSKGTISYRDMKCHYSETAKLTYTCTKGELNSSGMCVYTETDTRDATLGYNCPSGYVSVGSDCAKTTGIAGTKKYNCPDSAKLKGNKCYTTLKTDAAGVYSCPDGYVASGAQCYKEEFLQAVKKYTCSRVYTLNGGKCEKYDIISPKARYE